MGLDIVCYGGVQGMLTGFAESTDHPNGGPKEQINMGILNSGPKAQKHA